MGSKVFGWLAAAVKSCAGFFLWCRVEKCCSADSAAVGLSRRAVSLISRLPPSPLLPASQFLFGLGGWRGASLWSLEAQQKEEKKVKVSNF